MAAGKLSALHVGEFQEEGGALLTSVDAVAAWARKNSIWPLPLGLSCCGIGFMATAAARFDRARFGRYSHRHLTKNLRLARVRSLFDPTLDLMLGVSTTLVLVFGGLFWWGGETFSGVLDEYLPTWLDFAVIRAILWILVGGAFLLVAVYTFALLHGSLYFYI